MASAEELMPESLPNNIQKNRFLQNSDCSDIKEQVDVNFASQIFGVKNEEKDQDSDEEQDVESSQVPKIDFKKLLEANNRELKTEYPVTKSHIEDCLIYQSKLGITFIIALECIFYQAKSQYYELLQPKNGQKNNRMGTENYKEADYDSSLQNMTFDQEPLNLIVDKQNAYLKSKKDLIVQTENKDAIVELFLTLWRINKKGGLIKKKQSKSFKFNGLLFQCHYKNNMQLRISDDEEIIFLVQGYKNNYHGALNPLSIKAWNIQLETIDLGSNFNEYLLQTDQYLTETKQKNQKNVTKHMNELKLLKEQRQKLKKDRNIAQSQKQDVKNKKNNDINMQNLYEKIEKKIEKIMTEKLELKNELQMQEKLIYIHTQETKQVDKISKINLINKQYASIIYLKNDDSDLEKIEIVQIKESYVVFSLDCRLININQDNYKSGYNLLDIPLNQPTNIQDISFSFQNNTQESVQKNKFFPLKIFIDTNKTNQQEGNIYFKVLYVCDKKYSIFSKNSKKKEESYVWTLVSFDLIELQKQGIDKMISYMGSKVSKELQKFDEIFNKYYINKQGIQELKKAKLDIFGKFYLLDDKLIDFQIENNPLKNLEIQSNKDFSMIGLKCDQSDYCKFIVFSQQNSEQIGDLYNFQEIQISGSGNEKESSIKFVRNQNLKSQMFCISENIKGSTCYVFFQKDNLSQKKNFRFDQGHHYSEQDVLFVENNKKTLQNEETDFSNLEIYGVTLTEYSQQICFTRHQLDQRIPKMKLLSRRLSDNQVFQCQYPCLASNLGMNSIIIHINLDPNKPISLIHNLVNIKKEEEQFVSFVDSRQFSDIGIDTRNIMIDTSVYFVYLTKSIYKAVKNSVSYERIFLNMIILDPYNKDIHVAHFQSSKVFLISKENQFADVALSNIIFRRGTDLQMITQFPEAIHHTTLDQDEFGIQNDLDLEGRQQVIQEIEIDQIEENNNRGDKKKLQALRNKLSGKMAPILIFMDKQKSQNLIYFAILKEDEEKIEIRQFDPDAAPEFQVRVILNLRATSLLAFQQLEDFNFVLIDSQAKIQIYQKENNQLIRVGKLFLHKSDQELILNKFSDFQPIIINKKVIVANGHTYYLFDKEENVIDNVMMSENLIQLQNSDAELFNILGPIKVEGQDAFIFIYVYKDANFQYFHYRQIMYYFPNTVVQCLINDFQESCNFSTFLQDETIMANFGHRYMKFSKTGQFIDEIDFSNEDDDFSKQDNYYVLYWFEYLCQIDDGVNKLIFLKNEYKLAENKYKFLIKQNIVAILVTINQIDQKKVFTFKHESSQLGEKQQKCFNQAKYDYFSRYSFTYMSEDNKYFLFYDKMLIKYGIWELKDQAEAQMEAQLKKLKRENNLAISKIIPHQDQNNMIQSLNNYISNLNKELSIQYNKYYKKFPEAFEPFQCIKQSKNFIHKFLQPIDLLAINVQIKTHKMSEGFWETFSASKLMDNNFSKFYSPKPIKVQQQDDKDIIGIQQNKEKFIKIIFGKNKPVQISAIGFGSASDFFHLDPRIMQIYVKLEGSKNYTIAKFFSYKQNGQLDPDFEKSHLDVKFKHRQQILGFMKQNPWEKIIKLKIVIQQMRDIDSEDFHLESILIYQKRKLFDFQFNKIKDIDFFDKSNSIIYPNLIEGDFIKTLIQSSDMILLNNEDNQIEYQKLEKLIIMAFLQQKNVIKHVTELVEYDNTTEIEKKIVTQRIIFAYCDQHNYNECNSRMNIEQHKDCFDLKNPSDLSTIDLIGVVIKHKQIYTLQVNLNDGKKDYGTNYHEKQEVFPFKRVVKLFGVKNKKSQIARIQKNIEKLTLKIEKEFLIEFGLESSKTDPKKFFYYQLKQRQLHFKFEEILKCKFGNNYAVIKQANQLCYFMIDEFLNNKQGSINLLKQRLSNNAQISEIFYTNDEQKIQIIAQETEASVLIVTTWNLLTDTEESMLQFEANEIENDLDLSRFLQHGLNYNHEKNNRTQGAMNYCIQGDMIIDLDNNLPFIYSEKTNEIGQKLPPKIDNLRKIFKDSSRYLSVGQPHMLIYTTSKINILYWRDILRQDDYIKLFLQTQDAIDAFKIKYGRGISLFHHFADDQRMITSVHNQYMLANVDGTITGQSQKMVPLLSLGLDDETQQTALEISLIQQKPGNLEMMVGMLKEFNNICSSKLMLQSLGQLLSQGNDQVLSYLDKAQFNPPLMQTPFVVEWPEDLEQFVFASQTSIVTKELLDEELQKYTGEKPHNDIEKDKSPDKNSVQKTDYRILNPDLSAHEHPFRRVVVQALDFDWLFYEDNAKNFLHILDSSSDPQVFSKFNIVIFVDLIWKQYFWKVVIYELIPYLIYTGLFSFLCSYRLQFLQLQKLENKSDINPEWNEQQVDNYYQKKLLLTWILIALTGFFSFISYLRELNQIIMKGRNYLYFWNLIDLSSITLNVAYLIILLIHIVKDSHITYYQINQLNLIGAFAVFLMWSKVFYWMKLFDNTAYFLAQLFETAQTVKGFGIMFIIILCTFANFYYILQTSQCNDGFETTCDEIPIVKNKFGEGFIDAIVAVFQSALGDFGALADSFPDAHNSGALIGMFLLSQFIVNMLFLNMLIAVMAEPFAIVKDNQESFKVRQRVEIIIDFLYLIDLKKVFKNKKYILIVKPESMEIQQHEKIILDLAKIQDQQAMGIVKQQKYQTQSIQVLLNLQDKFENQERQNQKNNDEQELKKL